VSLPRRDFLALLATTKGNDVIDLRDRAIILFLADTGCRVGGVCALHLGDVDLPRKLATLAEKGEKTRKVPFSAATAQTLQEWLEVRPTDKGDWFFVGLGNRANDAVSPNGIAKMLSVGVNKPGLLARSTPTAFGTALRGIS
jgi:site-specific recombinase XerD